MHEIFKSLYNKTNILKDKNFYILTSFSVIFYILIIQQLKVQVDDSLLYSSIDAKSYLDVANWLVGGELNHSLSIRPFLYPLIIVFTSVFVSIGLWFTQFLMWLITINVVFYSIKHFTKRN